MKKETILGLSVFGLGVLQTPIFYFYTFGLFAILVGVPYMLLGLCLTICFFKTIVRSKQHHFPKVFLSLLSVIGALSALGGFFIDKEDIDWEWRVQEREQIVQEIINGQVRTENNLALVKLNNFPPISNGGNEIFVVSHPDGTFTITFWIDRGFLDESSEFVYSNNYQKQALFDEIVLKQKNHKAFRKIKDNWYRLNQF
mgnify:FL=1